MCESVGILFLIYLVAGSSLACDISSIRQCQHSFMNDLGISGNKTLEDLDILDAGRFDPVCSSFKTFKQCFDPLDLKCLVDSETTRDLLYLNDMYTYLCKIGRADLVRYSACWTTKDVQNGTSQCLTKFSMTTHSNKDFCDYQYNTLSCMNDVVHNHCRVNSSTVYMYIMSNSFLRKSPQIQSCEKAKQTFGTVEKHPDENGSSKKPMTSVHAMCIAMILLLSLKNINLFY